jgi:hypothetical protein
MARRVIVTGSTGNLGAKAVAALSRLDGWEAVRLGRNSANDPGVIFADLERYDAGWARHFDGAAAVLHLAADPNPSPTGPRLRRSTSISRSTSFAPPRKAASAGWCSPAATGFSAATASAATG